jgi:hypothetical protein
MERNELGNVVLNEGFKQVCVWPAVVVGEDKVDDFVQWFKDEFETRVQFLEEVETKPDTLASGPIPGTGGRHDVFFAVHTDDIGRFAVPRLSVGIRWIEDVFLNGHGGLYDDRFAAYKSW